MSVLKFVRHMFRSRQILLIIQMVVALNLTRCNDTSSPVQQSEPYPRMVIRPNQGMVIIPAKNSTFLMGTTDSANYRMSYPPHMVTLLHDFWMDETEVTCADYHTLMDSDSVQPPHLTGLPVSVNWIEAALYCNERSKRDNLDTVYLYTYYTDSVNYYPEIRRYRSNITVDTGVFGYRMPNEAEWEYASHGGTTGHRYWGNSPLDSFAWYDGNSSMRLQVVGQKKPNGFGLYDICGNAWEWCNDKNAQYDSVPQINPYAGGYSEMFIVRGGCGSFPAKFCSSVYRGGVTYTVKSNPFLGLRVVLKIKS